MHQSSLLFALTVVSLALSSQPAALAKKSNAHKVQTHKVTMVKRATTTHQAPVIAAAPSVVLAPVAQSTRTAAFGNCGAERDNVEGNATNEQGEYEQIIDFGR